MPIEGPVAAQFRLRNGMRQGTMVAPGVGVRAAVQLRIPLIVITSSGIMITDSGDCDHPPERSED